MSSSRIPLLYTLHSGNLYGTERMALATIEALGDPFDAVIFAPPGPVHAEADRLGLRNVVVHSDKDFLGLVRPWFSSSKRLALFSTRVIHSLIACGLNAFYRRKLAHVHMIHGGADEAISYGKKRRLNRLPITLVAVSSFVQERLLAHGVNPRRVKVIENFLTEARVSGAPRRESFQQSGIREAIVISRLDPIKRIDVLFEALERHPELCGLRIRIFGRGDDEAALKARAAASRLNVVFHGFSTEVDRELAASDVLIHLCSEEPFGLAVLEAMAARVPVVVPDAGGAGSLVQPGQTGVHFKAGDAVDLARRLVELDSAPAWTLNELTGNAEAELGARFSQREGGRQYRQLIEEYLQ